MKSAVYMSYIFALTLALNSEKTQPQSSFLSSRFDMVIRWEGNFMVGEHGRLVLPSCSGDTC